MKRKPRTFLLFLMFLALSAVLHAGEINVSIRYRDMRIYYLDTDPIWVEVTVTNRGPGPYRFKLADERAFSIDFDVRTTTNRPAEAADILLRKRSQSQSVYFREVLIEAGESFSFIENLRDFSNIDRSGAYIVQAVLFPELYRPEYFRSQYTGQGVFQSPVYINPVQGNMVSLTGADPMFSNRLSLNIRPPTIMGPDGVPYILDIETNAILVREKLPPDEVVTYLLTARQKEQWEKFFLYLDLEAMLSRDAYRRRQWLAESEEGRQRMISRYRTELQSSVIDGDIAAIPANFIIERTVYNADEGTVTALQYFRTGGYTERKRYTYYLHRKDGIWNIVDYSVVNLGTE